MDFAHLSAPLRPSSGASLAAIRCSYSCWMAPGVRAAFGLSSANVEAVALGSWTARSSTSNWSVAEGGIVGGIPLAPYAYCGAHVRVLRSPTLIVERPTSQPPITLP